LIKVQRNIILTLGAALAILLGAWLLRPARKNHSEEHREKAATRSSANPTESTRNTIIIQGANPRPRLFKATRYPPETFEEKAMWDWWRAMEKADPKFEWKMPIEFYGTVIDQHGEPIHNALVDYAWNVVGGTSHRKALTESNGQFSLTGERGKIFQVAVSKAGYLPTPESKKSFEYAAFFQENFHVPDPTRPVVFRLQKLMGAEPMLKFIANAEIDIAAAITILNVETGKLGPEGDLSFSIVKGPKRGQYGPDFSITITALNGAAFAFSEQEFMFRAPDGGYQSAAILSNSTSEPNYNRVQPYRFYVKTRSGKYAAVTGEITIREGLSEGKAGFHAIIYHNPSGSRNLEFDHRKWINR
jgi:hypothetical protein